LAQHEFRGSLHAMDQRKDAAWVTGVLQDVADFLAENEMPASAKAVSLALAAVGHERLLQRGGHGNLNTSPDLVDGSSGSVLRFPMVARGH
jgi:hypothetical protein